MPTAPLYSVGVLGELVCSSSQDVNVQMILFAYSTCDSPFFRTNSAFRHAPLLLQRLSHEAAEKLFSSWLEQMSSAFENDDEERFPHDAITM